MVTTHILFFSKGLLMSSVLIGMVTKPINEIVPPQISTPTPSLMSQTIPEQSRNTSISTVPQKTFLPNFIHNHLWKAEEDVLFRASLNTSLHNLHLPLKEESHVPSLPPINYHRNTDFVHNENLDNVYGQFHQTHHAYISHQSHHNVMHLPNSYPFHNSVDLTDDRLGPRQEQPTQQYHYPIQAPFHVAFDKERFAITDRSSSESLRLPNDRLSQSSYKPSASNMFYEG